MARPKVITLEQGEVSLQGFPAEISTALAEYIKNFEQPTIIVPAGVPVEHTESIPANKAYGPLTEKALAILHRDHKHSLVTISYSPETGEAQVEKIEETPGIRDAEVAFKVKSVALGFIV